MNTEAATAQRLATGLQLAHEIAQSGVWLDDLCAFHGALPGATLTSPPRFGSLGASLYEGSAGIARFLGYAAKLADDAALRQTALAALRHALQTTSGWSLFTGGMGVGVVALELAEVLAAPEFVPPAIQCIETASAAALTEQAPYDFLVGTAGVIYGLVAAQRYDLDGGWAQRAQALGQALLAAAVVDGPEDGCLSWPLMPDSIERLCGLAHGAAGCALAFTALAQLQPNELSWAQLAQRARAYERTYYSAAHGSWADLRLPAEKAEAAPTQALTYPHMWCHGSIGITAERLLASATDILAKADAVGGLAGVTAHLTHLCAGPAGPGADDAANGSLCHGIAGALDLLIDAWQVTDDTHWLALANTAADFMCNDARRSGGWRTGLRVGLNHCEPTPGLMLGTAGIGWAFLRVARPEKIPSGWRIEPLK